MSVVARLYPYGSISTDPDGCPFEDISDFPSPVLLLHDDGTVTWARQQAMPSENGSYREVGTTSTASDTCRAASTTGETS
jgi:hypothetical protein